MQSVYKSTYDGPIEVYVVDNDSSDGSQEMVMTEFPQVKLIANDQNLGFSKANNLAIRQASTHYTLILNPDTIIEERTLSCCAAFMEAHPEAGAIGVKMVDGSGTYLPESKRGFPSPLTAFFKMSGLAKLFPRSKTINRYYLGHLSSSESNPIEVLTGAFTFAKTKLLQEIGGYDEDYFMYGEDIELSYQIKERGKEIYFVPDTQIIHFKGESTKKITTSYLKNFYGAMGIYAKKRNTASTVVWSWLLSLAIMLSAIAGVLKKISLRQLRPVLDLFLLLGLAMGLRYIWAVSYFKDADYYADTPFYTIYPWILALIVFCYYLFGQYDKRHNLKHLTYGFVVSALTSLSIYSLLPLHLRFSRIVLLLVAVAAPLVLYLSRRIYNGFFNGTFSFNTDDARRVAVVGSPTSYEQIKPIVSKFSGDQSLVGRVGVTQEEDAVGMLADLNQIVNSRGINELLFCSKDMSTTEIFKNMAIVGSSVTYKVANSDNTSILGSNSKERVGEWYALDISFKIDEPFHKRTKRLLDLLFCLLLIITFPISIVVSSNRAQLFSSLLPVLFGKKSWIGYDLPDSKLAEIPALKPSAFMLQHFQESSADSHATNLWYARNFTTWSEAVRLAKLLF